MPQFLTIIPPYLDIRAGVFDVLFFCGGEKKNREKRLKMKKQKDSCLK